jgi:hypothetical protein
MKIRDISDRIYDLTRYHIAKTDLAPEVVLPALDE